jgi:hypothetical protein
MRRTQKAEPVNGREKTVQTKIKEIQSFLSCLFYLIQEANREELPFVADVLKEAIAKIDRLSNCDELREASANIIDNSLFEAMNFLHTLAGLSAEERSDYMKVFEILRQTLHIGPEKNRAPKSRRFGLVLQ